MIWRKVSCKAEQGDQIRGRLVRVSEPRGRRKSGTVSETISDRSLMLFLGLLLYKDVQYCTIFFHEIGLIIDEDSNILYSTLAHDRFHLGIWSNRREIKSHWYSSD